MKKQFLLWMCGSITFGVAKAQLMNTSGGYIVQTGNYMVLQDIDLANSGTFNPSAGSVRFSGSGNNSISGTTSPSFYTLEINKSTGNQLNLQQNISVNSYINFLSGLINLSGNNITLNGTAYLNNESETTRITGTTGGYVQATATLNAPASANPGNLGAVITTAENPGVTVIRRGHVSQVNVSGTGNSIYRYYDITPTTVPSSLTLRLNYFDAELNGLTEASLVMWKSADALHWTMDGVTSEDATANYVEYSAIPDINQRWTLSTINNALPIGLVSFRVNCQTDAVNLQWNTAGNITSGAFEVQRSSDGIQWVTIATVQAGSGNQYTYADKEGGSKYLYRLKISADNNSVSYSDIKSSGCAIKSSSNLYPNPATNYLQLRLNNMPDAALSLTLYTSSGQVLMTKAITVNGSSGTYTLPVTGLPAGIYHVLVQSPGYKKTFVFVKQ